MMCNGKKLMPDAGWGARLAARLDTSFTVAANLTGELTSLLQQ